MRGKADPKGAKAASDNSGTKAKADALTAAPADGVRTRRAEKAKAPSQRSLARSAGAETARAAGQAPGKPYCEQGHAADGEPKAAKSGALNDAGARAR